MTPICQVLLILEFPAKLPLSWAAFTLIYVKRKSAINPEGKKEFKKEVINFLLQPDAAFFLKKRNSHVSLSPKMEGDPENSVSATVREQTHPSPLSNIWLQSMPGDSPGLRWSWSSHSWPWDLEPVVFPLWAKVFSPTAEKIGLVNWRSLPILTFHVSETPSWDAHSSRSCLLRSPWIWSLLTLT